MNKEQEDQAEKLMKGIKQQMLVELPTRIKNLSPEIQADINRVNQKVFQTMEGLGKLTPVQLQKKIDDLQTQQANLTEKYGIDGNK